MTRNGAVLEVSLADRQVLRAHRVIVGIGRSGNFRKLGVPGEDLDKVYNRLHDPRDFCGQNVLVVGGGDSALETAIALGGCGAHVTLSYRKPQLSRPKPDNVEMLRALSADPMADVAVEEPSSERVTTATGGFLGEHEEAGSVRLMLGSTVREIRETETVVTDHQGRDQTLANDAVFSMIGREAPLGFFRRSGVAIRGEMTARSRAGLAALPSLLHLALSLEGRQGGPLPREAARLAEPEPGHVVGGAGRGRGQPRRDPERPLHAPRDAEDLGLRTVLLLHAGLLASSC